MTKIKILRFIIALLITLNIAAIFGTSYMYFTGMHDMLPQKLERDLNIANFRLLVNSILLVVALVFVYLALVNFTRRGYFNRNSAMKLRIGGSLIMAAALVSIIFALSIAFHQTGTAAIKLLSGTPTDVILLLVGFALLIIADFIRKVEAIEHENKLTI